MNERTFQDINTLIELFEDSDWQELSIEVKDFSLRLSRQPATAGLGQQSSLPVQDHPRSIVTETPPATDESAAPSTASMDEQALDGLAVVRAPNLGLFYRSPKPGAPPYVRVGEEVSEDTEVCLIEVMKLFTPVVAGVSGMVRSIRVEDGALVEYGQPLFYVEPQP